MVRDVRLRVGPASSSGPPSSYVRTRCAGRLGKLGLGFRLTCGSGS